MNPNELTPRRSFLGRIVGVAAVLPIVGAGAAEAQTAAASAAAWTREVKGSHRTLFDFPQHRNGLPLLHVLNYLNTYQEAFKAAAGTTGAVGTFYGIGPQSSISMAFNDAIWSKYKLGEYTGLKDAAGQPYTRNVFFRPTKNDLHLLMQAINSPTIPGFADAMPGLGIESLQKMGTKFLLCANALGGWCMELEARGKGKSADIQKELQANVLPGVTVVPAMVIAIEQAQAAGIRYNRQ
jgi:hypothetical protein